MDDKPGTTKPNEQTPKDYPIDKIRMGDITGPCGNANCSLAHKVKTYLRSQEAYKTAALEVSIADKVDGERNRKMCGRCGCKDDQWHRDSCSANDSKPVCLACGGLAQTGETCDDRLKKYYGTGVTPKQSAISSPKDE